MMVHILYRPHERLYTIVHVASINPNTVKTIWIPNSVLFDGKKHSNALHWVVSSADIPFTPLYFSFFIIFGRYDNQVFNYGSVVAVHIGFIGSTNEIE